MSLMVLTLWIFLQGYSIVTGQSREAAMGLVVTALRAALIIGVATSMAQGSARLYWTLTDGVSQAITKTVTGSSKSPYEAIDKNLMLMQVAMSALDQIKTGLGGSPAWAWPVRASLQARCCFSTSWPWRWWWASGLCSSCVCCSKRRSRCSANGCYTDWALCFRCRC
ncbi:VirB6 protein [Xanthomonas citri pv. citri str. 306]|uniref:VirB6 protein n=1 Tax=Xanthomonas axonopodis pv. citri (strain 306) TaxID=190486 RepID=A0AAI7ZGB9_XANAC|nr:VirB6 protein [Xanthomonas citri pv. citri str. 306]